MTAVLPRSLFAVKRGLCPGCGSPLPIDLESASTICSFCGTSAVLERRLRRREPEVEGAPLPLFLDVGGAATGRTGAETPWIRSKRFRGSFVDRVVCPGCGDALEVTGDEEVACREEVARCASCGTESVVERRLWAEPPDPATEVPRPRHPSECRGGEVGRAEDQDPETEHLVYRIVSETDPLRKVALAWKMSDSWRYANRTASRLLPALFASMKGAEPAYQYAAAQIVGKLLCEGDPQIRNAAVRAAERFLCDTSCPRELVFEMGMGSAVCLKPLLDSAEMAMRRDARRAPGEPPGPDREYACAALLGIDWVFQRNYGEHAIMGEILLYRMLYLTGPVLAYALLIAQRQRIGFFYPAETLLRFMDEAAVERPSLLPELDRAFYTGLPADEGEYRRRRAVYDTLKTDASRRSALTRWLWPPEAGPPGLYREIAAFLLPLLDDAGLAAAAEKALVDLVETPAQVPEAVHELVRERRDGLPAEVRRAYLRREPGTTHLDPRAIPYWQGEKEPGLSPEIRKALEDWNEGLAGAIAANEANRAAFRELLPKIRELELPVFDGVSDGPVPRPLAQPPRREEPAEELPPPNPAFRRMRGR